MLTPRFQPSRLTRINSGRGALKPGGHHVAVLVPNAAKTVPVAGGAPEDPILNYFADRELIRRQCLVASRWPRSFSFSSQEYIMMTVFCFLSGSVTVNGSLYIFGSSKVTLHFMLFASSF